MNLHLALLLLYLIAQVLLGLLLSRRVTSGDFFVAGRKLGPGLLFATLVAANIGAGSTVGATGLGYRDGLSAWWWVGSAGIGSITLAFTVGPRIWRIAATHDLRTVGDFLEHRYDQRVRGVVAGLLWLGSLALLAGQFLAIAWVLNVVAGVPKPIGCLVGGLVATSYFTAGGLASSARVNIVQVVVKLVGFGVALPMALQAAGGWTVVSNLAPAAGDYWSFWRGGASGWNYVALLAPAFVVSPGILQKVYGARDERAVRRGVAGAAAALFAFAAVPVVIGMVARVLHPGLGKNELALPTIFTRDLPPAVGTLGLAAVVSAELSSADAILFMLATSLSQDLYRRFLNPAAGDARLLFVSRAAALGAGALGTALAIVSPSVIDALSVFYSLLTVSLFVPIVAGLYLDRVRTPDALAAIATGVTALLVFQFVPDAREFGFSAPLAGLLAAGLACSASAAVRR